MFVPQPGIDFTTTNDSIYVTITIMITITITITMTNYLFRQNRTRNITKVILITHTKIQTLQRLCQGDYT